MPRTANRKHAEYGRSPKKGTKTRAALILMLRPQGATSEDFKAIGLGGRVHSAYYGAYIEVLINQKGWDIRTFDIPNRGHKGPRVRYKVIGKYLPKRRYRSLISSASSASAGQAEASPTQTSPL